MAATDIPDSVRRFIVTNIPSIPYLEALLLLRGDTLQPWDGTRLARALYIDEAIALSLLEALNARGVVTPATTPATFCYQPISEELTHMIDALADVYATHLVDVTNLVHARSSRNAQRFADAFVWRKDS
jgi:hypothetical protein